MGGHFDLRECDILRRTINRDSLLLGVLIRALLFSSRGSLLLFPVLRGCYLDE